MTCGQSGCVDRDASFSALVRSPIGNLHIPLCRAHQAALATFGERNLGFVLDVDEDVPALWVSTLRIA
jgi:hypothetical protein